MLSLSGGYLIGGKLSTRNPTMTKFGIIFFLAALLLAPLIYLSESAMELIFLYITDPRYGSLLASTVLFMVPTVFLGMISPYSVRLLIESVAKSGEVAGRLYFVSTLGSSLGTLATSFYLVLWFEINTILIFMTGSLTMLSAIALGSDKWVSR